MTDSKIIVSLVDVPLRNEELFSLTLKGSRQFLFLFGSCLFSLLKTYNPEIGYIVRHKTCGFSVGRIK